MFFIKTLFCCKSPITQLYKYVGRQIAFALQFAMYCIIPLCIYSIQLENMQSLQFAASKLNAATYELVMGQADFAWLLVGF